MRAGGIVWLLLLCSMVWPGEAGLLVTYWGQNGNEGSLADACNSGIYDIVVLSFLNTFGNGQQPQLNLAGHCDPAAGTCTSLSSDIDTCHNTQKKVLLSIGGAAGTYSLQSDAEASTLASYLWNNFLGGQSTSRPLGASSLDGIDFDIEQGSPDYYPSLAQYLRNYDIGMILSAAPQCPYPDAYMGPAISTGLFQYVWVQFYNNPPCQYSGGDSALVTSWNTWTSSLPSSLILLGLPASTDAAPSGGFIASSDLISTVLPDIKGTSKYGGVMIYSRYYDGISGYGAAIRSSV